MPKSLAAFEGSLRSFCVPTVSDRFDGQSGMAEQSAEQPSATLSRRDMTDPTVSLHGLQIALNARTVQLRQCDIYSDLMVLLDYPRGKPRFTYAVLEGNTVQAVAVFVLAEPYDGIPCFQLGYAVLHALRGRGLGSRVVTQSIEELSNGLRRNSLKAFYLEAIVSTGNEASNAIARKYISPSPSDCTDSASSEAALQYLRRVTLIA